MLRFGLRVGAILFFPDEACAAQRHCTPSPGDACPPNATSMQHHHSNLPKKLINNYTALKSLGPSEFRIRLSFCSHVAKGATAATSITRLLSSAANGWPATMSFHLLWSNAAHARKALTTPAKLLLKSSVQ